MSLMPYAEFLLGAGLGAFYLPLKTPSSKILACVAGYIGFVLGALVQCVGAAALGYQVPPAPDALGVFAVAGIAPAAVIGAVIVGVLRNGLTLMGVQSVYQVLITGILVIAAVAVDQLSRKGAR